LELLNTAFHLHVRVKLVLDPAHGCWLEARVALWDSVLRSSGAVGARFGLRAWIWFRHDRDYCDS
jgi:hypothetical protein